jgi:hypothetical protein
MKISSYVQAVSESLGGHINLTCIVLYRKFLVANMAKFNISMRIGQSGFDIRQGQRINHPSILFRPPIAPSQPPIQWVPENASPDVKSQRREVDHIHLLRRCKLTIPYALPTSWQNSGIMRVTKLSP